MLEPSDADPAGGAESGDDRSARAGTYPEANRENAAAARSGTVGHPARGMSLAQAGAPNDFPAQPGSPAPAMSAAGGETAAAGRAGDDRRQRNPWFARWPWYLGRLRGPERDCFFFALGLVVAFGFAILWGYLTQSRGL